ncbi:hypothetical protein GCM10007304_10120 [Rhodococcoides trifolii]|uniref:Alternate-type signal peptide domain-containing protein n=1 Tax=Rhodococcoides trifolii TaxID=908250 RepID=A0A917FPT7_9NOCA|nr:alternate-type signal peptide domain-containing protein [Rhodococcus trifolii]GGF98122.1 hypothetical protein GCM10007304_10120 [Rhodococcus trifolii]
MNKTTKGALAAGAAAVLLLGGAGSFALWQDQETVNEGTITAGILDIAPLAAGQWFDVSPDQTRVAIDPAGAFRMVPGDVLEYNATFTVTATGKNLTATINGVPGTVVYGGGLTATNAPVVTTATIGTTTLANNAITSADTGKTVSVKSTLTFDKATGGQIGQNGTVNLASYQVAVQQTRPGQP